MLDVTSAHSAAALVTVPLVGYVAADKSPAGDVRNSGSNYLSTRFKQSRVTKGSALQLPPDTTDGYVNQDEFVNWVKSTWPNQPVIFSIDNEPDLWSDTHPEMHPNPVGLRRAVHPQRHLRHDGEDDATRVRSSRAGQLRLGRLRQPAGRARRRGQGRVPRLLPRPR